jgi:DNA-binding transcriptional LysR family regulator
LRYFLLVAEELHFGRAAVRAGIDSSPLSRQIVDLEERLGVKLFARDRRHTKLTVAGRMFVDDVRRIFTDLDTSIERLLIAASGEGVPFRIGLAEGAAGPEFGRFIQLARKAQPSIQITLVEKPAVKLFALLARGGLDAAFTLSGPDGDADLDAQAMWRGRLCVVVAPDHWAASRKGVALAEMRQEAWIMPDREAIPGYAGQVDQLLRRHQIRPSVPTIAAHQNSITQLAAAGVGVGLVAEGITRGADGAVMMPLTDEDAILEGWFICRRDDPSHVLSRVRELVQQVAQNPNEFQRPLP